MQGLEDSKIACSYTHTPSHYRTVSFHQHEQQHLVLTIYDPPAAEQGFERPKSARHAHVRAARPGTDPGHSFLPPDAAPAPAPADDNMMHIDDGAFYNSNNLIQISLPDTVTHIGDRRFAYCTYCLSFKSPPTLIALIMAPLKSALHWAIRYEFQATPLWVDAS